VPPFAILALVRGISDGKYYNLLSYHELDVNPRTCRQALNMCQNSQGAHTFNLYRLAKSAVTMFNHKWTGLDARATHRYDVGYRGMCSNFVRCTSTSCFTCALGADSAPSRDFDCYRSFRLQYCFGTDPQQQPAFLKFPKAWTSFLAAIVTFRWTPPVNTWLR
jgi:hypothetical protein